MWKNPAGNFVGCAVRVERTVVGDHVDPEAGDLAVLRAHLGVHHVVAREAGGNEVLGAVLDPLDRHAGHDRAGDRADVAGIHRNLVAEAAADVVALDADHVLGQPRDVRIDGAVRMRRLIAVVDVELAGLGIEVGDDAARLERRRMAARIDDVAFDNGVGLRERAVGGGLVAGFPGRAGEVVALARLVVADQRRVRVERFAGVDDRGQRLVLDVDQLERVVRRVLVRRDHERDFLALESDLVTCEHGLGVVGDRRHPGEPERLEVLGGDDCRDVGVGEGPRGVDRENARVRVRASQQCSVDHPRQPDVVEVVALAADEACVFLALQATEADRALGLGARKVLDDGHARTPWLAALLVLGGPADGGDDVLVARAAADRTRDRRADLVVGRVGVLVEQCPCRHQHPGRAEAALERVQLVEALLHRIEHAVDLERLDRPDLMAFGHGG